ARVRAVLPGGAGARQGCEGVAETNFPKALPCQSLRGESSFPHPDGPETNRSHGNARAPGPGAGRRTGRPCQNWRTPPQEEVAGSAHGEIVMRPPARDSNVRYGVAACQTDL